MQGRLQGKRLTAPGFVEAVADHGAEACNYLLAVDVDMNTVDGYAMSSWERGYGDFVMTPDFDTLCPLAVARGHRAVPGRPRVGRRRAVVASPRQVLRAQLARLAERGWQAHAGTELEFIVFDDSYEQAWDSAYRGLTPANRYNVDYSMLGTARVEPLLRRIRNAMMDAGMVVEDSKGECNFGQHEINFHFADALRTADQHVIYKNGAKEIAAQDGKAITFMAKFNEREGNSCHLHLSLRGDRRRRSCSTSEEGLFDRFLAGMLAGLRELTLFLAPNINSYKRYAARSFAPTTVAWGHDNRTCALRVVGHGAGRRIECRVPGADVNPYLAISALIAAGLHGVDSELDARARVRGQRLRGHRAPAGALDAARCPRPVRGERDRARRLRRRGRRALPQQRARRARGLRRGGHGLGAVSGLRAPVGGGSCSARRSCSRARRLSVTECISSRARRAVSSRSPRCNSPIPAIGPTRRPSPPHAFRPRADHHSDGRSDRRSYRLSDRRRLTSVRNPA